MVIALVSPGDYSKSSYRKKEKDTVKLILAIDSQPTVIEISYIESPYFYYTGRSRRGDDIITRRMGRL